MLVNDFISFDIDNSKKNINLNLIYENIGSIPKTENALLDWGYDGSMVHMMLGRVMGFWTLGKD